MDYLENLRKRAEIVRGIRAFFDARGFTEVTTPVRIAAPAPEAHIDCPTVVANGAVSYLRASPELQMKKLLAAGMDRIYQIGPCFREGEFGARHNPEFTMIEWYRREADYRDIYHDMVELLRECHAAGRRGYVEGLPQADVPAAPSLRGAGQFQAFCELKVRDAYLQFAGWDPWTDWDQDRFDYDMATKIEPNLGEGFVSLWDYPPQAASLAVVREGVAERWELYLNGIELANCFTELCDGEEQRRRFLTTKEERKALGESDYPIDEEFLSLVPLMKSASGVALGVDRLVAALLGEPDIHAVLVGE